MDVMQPGQWSSKFNAGLQKLDRINELQKSAHRGRIEDDHNLWKVSLDAIYSEIWAYISNKKYRDELDTVKVSANNLILKYLEWQHMKLMDDGVKYHETQKKQIELENVLDRYQRLLIGQLNTLKMDMPAGKDLHKLLEESYE